MFNQFHINRVPIDLKLVKSSIFLFLCIQSMFSLIQAKSSKDNDDGSNIIVLGAGGQLATSRYVPRKSGKGSSTIIIVGPPILIEEVKGTEEGHIDYHVTSQPNSVSPQITQFPLNYNSVNGNHQVNNNNNNQHGSEMSSLYPSTVNSNPQMVIGDEDGHRPMKTNSNGGGLNGLNGGFTTVNQMSPMSSVNSMNSMNSMGSMSQLHQLNQLNQLNQMNNKLNQLDQLNQMNNKLNQLDGIKKIMDNSNAPTMSPGYVSTSTMNQNQGVALAEHTISPYTYNSPTTSSISPMSENSGFTIKSNKDNSENQEIYDEKVFNQFYGFDQVPSVDLGNLASDEHLPNLLFSNNNDNDEGNRRLDPTEGLLDQENLDLGTYGPKRSGLDSLMNPPRLLNRQMGLPMNEQSPPRWNDDFIPLTNIIFH